MSDLACDHVWVVQDPSNPFKQLANRWRREMPSPEHPLHKLIYKAEELAKELRANSMGELTLEVVENAGPRRNYRWSEAHERADQVITSKQGIDLLLGMNRQHD